MVQQNDWWCLTRAGKLKVLQPTPPNWTRRVVCWWPSTHHGARTVRRWVRLPFGLTVKGDAFQERLNRVLKSVPSTTGIADDILFHGNAEIPHNAVVITLLLETARANYLTSNKENFVFKTKVQAITEIRTPQNLQDLQSSLSLVNHLNHFSPKMADLTAPLRSLCQKGVVFTWESSKQEAFEAIKKEITMALVLAYFDKWKTSAIQSDASKKGLVLFQDGKPDVYASRRDRDRAMVFKHRERERVVKCCLCPWKISSLLVWLYSDCSYIEDLKGKENIIADALSRVSPQPVRESKVERDVIPADTASIADFQRTTADDMTSGLLMHKLS